MRSSGHSAGTSLHAAQNFMGQSITPCFLPRGHRCLKRRQLLRAILVGIRAGVGLVLTHRSPRSQVTIPAAQTCKIAHPHPDQRVETVLPVHAAGVPRTLRHSRPVQHTPHTGPEAKRRKIRQVEVTLGRATAETCLVPPSFIPANPLPPSSFEALGVAYASNIPIQAV